MPPQLLISCKTLEEAHIAHTAGADIIDFKEPSKGPLGPISKALRASILNDQALSGLPLSLAQGELKDSDNKDVVTGFSYIKYGLAEMLQDNWQQPLKNLKYSLENAWGAAHQKTYLVPVIYADHHIARSPAPEDILDWVLTQNETIPGLLIDTFDKSHHESVLQIMDLKSIQIIQNQLKSANKQFALAGQLTLNQIENQLIAEIKPDIIGIRGAACTNGRSGDLCPRRIKSLIEHLSRLND